VLTWQPNNYTLASVASGAHDDWVRAFAKGAAAWGKTIYLRPMHEMNGDWYPWGRGVNGNTPADFIAAWRHLHDIFDEEGATKVKWVFSPNVRYGKEYPFADLYPGSRYVDWVALDGYNWGLDHHLGVPTWQSFSDIFGATYSQLVDVAPGKPMMIAEMASTENGGDKAAWITNTFMHGVLKFPAIRAVIYQGEPDGASDFRINSSAASLAAFRDVYNSALWSARLP
jgi:beta-mannanase